MIKQIKELKNIGIFHNYLSNSELPVFNKFNLIYGWNGSGKSTLSNLMNCFGNPDSLKQFPDGKIKIEMNNGDFVTEKNIETNQLSIKVFNQKFIEENIDWKGKLNPILFISHEKIELKKEYDEISEKIRVDDIKESQLVKQLEESRKEDDKFKQSAAKNIKTVFQTIETTDQKYLNYNKKNIDIALQDGIDILLSGDKKLSDEEYVSIVKSLKPNQKENIEWVKPTIQKEVVIDAENIIIEILNTSVLANVIDRLIKYPEISNWIEVGLSIHQISDNCKCEFCGGNLTQTRLQELEQHFNKDYEEFKLKVASKIEWIESLKIEFPILSKEIFYDELQQQFLAQFKICHEKIAEYNAILEKWVNYLRQKNSNPFNQIHLVNKEGLADLCVSIFQEIQAFKEIVNSHNFKTDDFANLLLYNKKSLEGHLITQQLQEFNYGQLINKTGIIENDLVIHKYLLELKKVRRLEIEKELISETLAANEFNKDLNKFLGRDELRLEFNKDFKGYTIVRPNGSGGYSSAKNLSEGEKTAIAFIYFITSLQEKGNILAECVVWIDDPISSFDSNHLFNAQIFIEKKCSGACQIFITTHNFWFFKVVRDWLKRRKKKENLPEVGHRDICLGETFRLTNKIENGSRCSQITDAGKALSNYHSEYHFLFKTLHESINNIEQDFSGAFQLANLSRRLLESFLSFKYPNVTNGFSSLIERVQTFDHEKKERIKWFLNKFSHSDRIEVLDNLPENLIEEGFNVAKETFELILAEDKCHYDNMLKACS